jgi:hypothetical protein
MPYKNHEKKREYHREYMRRRRAAVKPDPAPVLNPAPVQAGPPERIDLTRPYTEESRYPWPAYLVQDGFWFDPKTGELVGKVR